MEPAENDSVMSCRTSVSASAWYLKLAWSKAIEPSGTSAIACAGLAMLGRSARTSPTRCTLVSARVMSRNTLEIIMSEFVICRT